MSEFLSVYDVAQLAGCSTRTVLRLIRRGDLPAMRLPRGKKYWITHEYALAYIADRKAKAAQAAEKARKCEALHPDFFNELFEL